MTDGLDSRYATYREQSELAERVTKLEASLMHLPSDVAELRRKVDALAPKIDMLLTKMDQAPRVDQSALGMHHVGDALLKLANAKPQQQNAVLMLAAGIGCISIGGWLVKLLGLAG